MPAASMVRVAVCQATPCLFDSSRGVAVVEEWVRRAAAAGAQLVLLPEAFLPGYPRGVGFGMVVGSRSEEGRRLYRELWQASVDVPGPETARIASTCRECGIHVAVGVIERSEVGTTLYCTLLLFGADGKLIWRHRKIKPTGSERLIWGEGDGSDIQVVATDLGQIGGLICWENYMPLPRVALYEGGVEIYLAPTADSRDTWQNTLGHIACEGRCFVLGCNQFVPRDAYPSHWRDLPEVQALPEIACRGGSAIYSPLGQTMVAPVYDREGLLIADLYRDSLVEARLDFDAVGHYARPDLFRLHRSPPRY